MRTRAFLLVTVIATVLLVVACGRASETEINQALGITPTPTPSAAQLASATARAMEVAAQRTAAAGAAGSPGSGGQVAALGDVTRGSRQFTTWCAACHSAAGAGGNILAPGGPGAAVTTETLLPLIREGTNHAKPPGPYKTTEIPDGAVADIAAYILSKAAP